MVISSELLIIVAPSIVSSFSNRVLPLTVNARVLGFLLSEVFIFKTVPPSTVNKPETLVFPSILMLSVRLASPSNCKLPSIATFPEADMFLWLANGK